MPFPLRRKSVGRRKGPRSRGLRHLLKTGLPPGVEREHVRDPGMAIRRKPNREE